MKKIQSGHIRKGMKLDIDEVPYQVIEANFTKPGKGQAFTRLKLKNLITGNVTDKTFKSNESIKEADIEEKEMIFLYQNQEEAFFEPFIPEQDVSSQDTFEPLSIPLSVIGKSSVWLMKDLTYTILLYEGTPVHFSPPTFVEQTIAETEPGLRGDSSGRVTKPAKTNTGAEVQVPIFITTGEKIKIDTRNGTYVNRA